jgi:hypothetical protein
MIRHLKHRAPLAALVATLALTATGRADGLEGIDAAIKVLPADTAFYGSMLRNREQVEIVAKSKAWAKLMDLPAVKFARQMIEAKIANPDEQTANALAFLKQPENKELIDFLLEASSDEIFIYGGPGWIDVTDLMTRVSGAVRFGPALAQLNPENRGKNPAELQARAALETLNENKNLIRVPELIIGFRVKDAKRADARVKRLEDLIRLVLANAPPPVRDGFKRVKVGESDLLNLTLEGSLIPWDDLNIKEYKEKEGGYDALLKKLKDLKLSVSLGVHKGYIVLAIGQSPDQVAVVGGKGKHLNDLPEFKPLAKFADKRLTSIGYSSKALKAATMPTPADYQGMAKTFGDLLKAAELPEEQDKKIRKDIESLASEMSKNLPEAGAGVAFSFLTESGSVGYGFDYNTFPSGPVGNKPLTLTDHVGGNAIFWFVTRLKSDAETYKKVVQALPGIYGHVEEAIFTKLDDDQKEQYRSVKKVVIPLLKRFDEITSTLLIPALADGQVGFVLDARWKSEHWQAMLPQSPKALPLPEIGILVGISNEDKFRKAMKGYFTLVNDALAAASELGKGQVPDLKLPEPTVVKAGDATLVYYPIPAELGLDPQVVPTAGLSKSVAVLTLSRAHTERLLKPTPVEIDGSPLAELKDKPLASASAFNWPALVDALTPWVEMGVAMAGLPPTPPGPEGDVLKQVRTVLEILKVFRGVSTVSYFEDGVLVTRSEAVMRDLK